jgi:G:T/U-mismatch repair DNA glycosylase
MLTYWKQNAQANVGVAPLGPGISTAAQKNGPAAQVAYGRPGGLEILPPDCYIGVETCRESALMVNEIWEPNMMAVFVSPAVLELSEKLGFPHMHPRDRFWELLELGGITPKRVITVQERKALTEGVTMGSLNEPVRLMFIEKRASRLVQLGIGITELNRRVAVPNEKDRSAIPDDNDIGQFLAKVERLQPRILAFITEPELLVRAFQSRFSGLTGTPGRQQFQMGNSEVWLLGSTMAQLRGESLTAQEDLFFALGERITALREESAT